MNPEEIEKLLEDGLALYGFGKTKDAVTLWRKILEFDKNNQKAIDYIQSAGYGIEQQEVQSANFSKENTEFVNINYIRELLKSRRYELAYEFLEHLIETHHSPNRHLTAYFFIVKAQLIKIYHESLYELKKAPRLNVNEQDIIKYNLNKEDVYILSMIDGYSDIEEVIQTISTMDQFETLKRFYKLTKLGIIGF